jgi:alkyl sulfatase BDS1-like metallo-beta-lactamase superfamily hydrolase
MPGIARERRVQESGATEAIEGLEIEFRIIPESEAKKVIERYIRGHRGCTTSEIIESTRLDPALVVEVLKLLEEEGKVKGEEVE